MNNERREQIIAAFVPEADTTAHAAVHLFYKDWLAGTYRDSEGPFLDSFVKWLNSPPPDEHEEAFVREHTQTLHSNIRFAIRQRGVNEDLWIENTDVESALRQLYRNIKGEIV